MWGIAPARGNYISVLRDSALFRLLLTAAAKAGPLASCITGGGGPTSVLVPMAGSLGRPTLTRASSTETCQMPPPPTLPETNCNFHMQHAMGRRSQSSKAYCGSPRPMLLDVPGTHPSNRCLGDCFRTRCGRSEAGPAADSKRMVRRSALPNRRVTKARTYDQVRS